MVALHYPRLQRLLLKGLVALGLTASATQGGQIPLRQVGAHDTPRYAYDVCLSGNMAIVADYTSGLHIIDVSDPTAPARIGGYDSSGEACAVTVSGTTAYLADGPSGLQIIDISNPAAPARLGSYNTPGYAYEIALSGSYAYVADGTPGLHILNISKPSAPAYLGTYYSGTAIYGITVASHYAYVIGSSLDALDLSNPASPQLVGQVAVTGSHVAVEGNYAYVANHALQVVEISDPHSPTLKGVYYDNWKTFGGHIAVQDHYVYLPVFGNYQGLAVVNASEPSHPVTSAHEYIGSQLEGVAVSGSYLFVANGDAGLSVWSFGTVVPDLDLYVSEVKVAQVLQDDSLPLIAGRPTLVRAAVQWKGPQSQVSPVDGLIRVYVDGQLWRGPIQSTGAITARTPVDWTQETSTINFVLSDIPESDDVDLEVELNPTDGTIPNYTRIPEYYYANNYGYRNTLKFECRREGVSVLCIPVDYRPSDPNRENLPNRKMMSEAYRLLQACLPMSLDYKLREEPHKLTYAIDTTLSESRWEGKLALISSWQNVDYAFAWFPADAEFIGGVGGVSQPLLGVAYSKTVAGSYQHRFAHELGHLLGVGDDDASFPKVPFVFDVAGQTWLTVDGLDVMNVLGLADRSIRILNSDAQAGQQTHGLMFHDATSDPVWVDVVSYTHFLSHTTHCGVLPQVAAEGQMQPLGLVSGLFDPVLPSAILNEVCELPAGNITPSSSEGNLLVRAYHSEAGNDQLVHETRIWAVSDQCSPATNCPTTFVAVVPMVAGDPPQIVNRLNVVLAETGEVLAERVRSDAVPQISILAPTIGQELIDGAQIAWNGTDADGDTLQYTLCYSWDDGQSQLPLEVNITETTFTLNAAEVPGSQPGKARLRLTATDGMNTVTTEVTGLTANFRKPPVVRMLSPADGQTVQQGAPVFLSASASDPEDRQVPEADIRWFSDRDGALGIGASLAVSSLSLGVHQLSVIATDSDGMSASSVVMVEVTERTRAATADFDHDGDVDSADLALFGSCASGPAIPYDPTALPPGCRLPPDPNGHIAPDFDKDGDVDQSDFGIFQRCYSGANRPADPNCAN